MFNGDIGVIEMIDRPSQSILVRYDDRMAQYVFDMADELDLAYAITVHKSQGSEFESVVMPLMGYHSKLHYRNLLYTGVTRAKREADPSGTGIYCGTDGPERQKDSALHQFKDLFDPGGWPLGG